MCSSDLRSEWSRLLPSPHDDVGDPSRDGLFDHVVFFLRVRPLEGRRRYGIYVSELRNDRLGSEVVVWCSSRLAAMNRVQKKHSRASPERPCDPSQRVQTASVPSSEGKPREHWGKGAPDEPR